MGEDMKIVEILEEFRKVFDNERDKGTAFEKLVKIYPKSLYIFQS